jgi:hypothetical protein
MEIAYYAGIPHPHANELRAEMRNPLKRVKSHGYLK